MKIRTFTLLIVLCSVIFTESSFAQMYSSTSYAFSIYDDNTPVESLKKINTFKYTNTYVSKIQESYGIKTDSTSAFEIGPFLEGDQNVQYQTFHRLNSKTWVIYSENVEVFRPIRYIKIDKHISDKLKETMIIFLNYDYDCCTTNRCYLYEDEFIISQIQFNIGNYILTDKVELNDWNNIEENKKIIKVDGSIKTFMTNEGIKYWFHK